MELNINLAVKELAKNFIGQKDIRAYLNNLIIRFDLNNKRCHIVGTDGHKFAVLNVPYLYTEFCGAVGDGTVLGFPADADAMEYELRLDASTCKKFDAKSSAFSVGVNHGRLVIGNVELGVNQVYQKTSGGFKDASGAEQKGVFPDYGRILPNDSLVFKNCIDINATSINLDYLLHIQNLLRLAHDEKIVKGHSMLPVGMGISYAIDYMDKEEQRIDTLYAIAQCSNADMLIVCKGVRNHPANIREVSVDTSVFKKL